jgi:multiple sugar transport system permease protein
MDRRQGGEAPGVADVGDVADVAAAGGSPEGGPPAPGPPRPRPAPAPSGLRARLAAYVRDEQARYGHWFVLPTLVYFLVFVAFPVVFSLYLSFHSWSPLSDRRTFVGLQNYAELLRSPAFGRTIANTVVFDVSAVAAIAAGSLALALALDQGLRGTGLFRAVFYSPVVTSFVATGLVWLWLLDPGRGPVNGLLGAAGLPRPGWASDPRWAMPSVVLPYAWREVGYFTIVYLAALQSVPEPVKEAARVDGAAPWQVFRHVTLPLLRPATLFVLVLGTIRATQLSFGIVYVMTGGGPAQATTVISLDLYLQAFQALRLGYASAVAYVVFLVVLVATLVQLRVVGRPTEG